MHTTLHPTRPSIFCALTLTGLFSLPFTGTSKTGAQESAIAERELAAAEPQVLEVHVPTAMRAEALPAMVVLPSAYATQPDRRFPVFYLLHGAGGDHRSWIDISDVESLADAHEMIVVCPDGGRTSWYFDSPLDPRYQFETFVAEEVVAHVDAQYRTRADRGGRAIGGLSMGGHGALFLAIRHPDVFGTAVAMSGGVDIRPFPGSWDIAQRIGTLEAHPERWNELTVIELARQLEPNQIAISIDCGVGDFFLEVNRALHARLVAARIPHDYTERPGGHSAAYWARCLPYQMVFVSEQFAR
ncbi:MAG: esterase family protein [Planctomycetes bacterium]|nr:esterase family protein [Planctomycetota bacterium]MCB9904364.1 esterase family protein [Planctomycetota bacterium]